MYQLFKEEYVDLVQPDLMEKDGAFSHRVAGT